MHVIHVLASGSQVVVDHLLEAHTHHDVLDLAAQFLGGGKASDGEVTRNGRLEVLESETDHDILDHIHGMQKVVSVLGACDVDGIAFGYAVDAHSQQCIPGFIGIDVLAQDMLDIFKSAAL